MRRKNSDEGEGGLDSLLDTMTNVVGILVIVLVVTQLGVDDAVKRIADSIKVDAEQLAADEEKLAQLKEQRDSLLAAMDQEEPVDESDRARQLEDLNRQIEQQQQLLDRLEQQKKAHEDAIKQNNQQATKVKDHEKALDDARQQVAKLNEEWKSKDEQLAQLQALLAETPERQVLPAREITLPDPRPAPEGAKQLSIVCSGNKVYLLPPAPILEQLRKAGQARFAMIAQKQYRTFKPAINEGIDRFLQEFNERPLRDQPGYFDIELYNSNGSPRLRFNPRENSGEDERAVKGTRSRFQQALRGVNPNMFYIKFYVCADSFDIYVTTRRIVSDMGIMAGWDPQGSTWKYTTHLGGSMRLGPPPKPAPKPKTPPPPAKPKKPANVID
jgi:hypothetical protein